MWFFPNRGLLLLHHNIFGLRGLLYVTSSCHYTNSVLFINTENFVAFSYNSNGTTPPRFYNSDLKFVNFELRFQVTSPSHVCKL